MLLRILSILIGRFNISLIVMNPIQEAYANINRYKYESCGQILNKIFKNVREEMWSQKFII